MDQITRTATKLICDIKEANRFLIALDHKAAHFTFQTFDDNADIKCQQLVAIRHGTLQKNWTQLIDISSKGAGVFVTVNETNLAGREEKNITRVRVLFVDLDGASLDPVLNDREVPKPHIIVESSPGKWHVYWLVAGVPLGAFRKLQKFLIHRFGGDKSVHDLPRVMRLPGFPHQKIKKGIISLPFLSRIESIHKAEPYSGDVFSSLMASAPLFDNARDNEEDQPEIVLDDMATDAEIIRLKYRDVDQEKIQAAVDAITADCSYDDWYRVGTIIRLSGLGIEVFDKWSATATDTYTDRATVTQWNGLGKMRGDFGPATLYGYADQQHPEWRNELDQRQLDEAIALIVVESTDRLKAKATPTSDNNISSIANTHVADADADEELGADDDDVSEEIIGNYPWPAPADLWGQLDPPELPLGLLPLIIEQLALVEGEHMGCDPAGLAISALVVCAAAIPDQVTLQVKKHDSWTECARLWAFLVGLPSTKKTPIINRATWPLKDIDKELYHEYTLAMVAYDSKSKDDQAKETTPRQRHIRIEDTTIEASQQIFADSREGLLCLQDELSGFFGMLDRYSGGSSKDRSFWLQAFNGGSYLVNRIKRGAIFIENLSACLLGGVQPDVIRRLSDDGVDDGLMQRAMPLILRTATAGKDEPHDMVNVRYGNMVKQLHHMDIPNQPLVFSAAAQVIRRELEAKHMKLQACELINKQLAGTIGKYDGLFARLCLTWQCIENMDAEHFQMTISEATAGRVADFLHQFLFGHACCFYLGMLAKADDHDRIAKVALFILAKKLVTISNRTIQRGNRAMRKMARKDTEDLLDHLDTFGWIARIKDAKGKVTNAVNPRVHELFAERGKREEERIKEARSMIAESAALRRKP